MTLELLDILTKHNVLYRITNLAISGLDSNGQPTYKPQYGVTIGHNGHELFHAMDSRSLDEAVKTAFDWAVENKLVSL